MRPLFSTFGLTAAADIMSWLLLGSVVAGYGLLASFLYRTGYATARMTALLPVPAIAVTAAYVVLVWALVPDHHVPDAVLSLVLFAFVPGAAWYLAITTLPIIASRGRAAQVLAERVGRHAELGESVEQPFSDGLADFMAEELANLEIFEKVATFFTDQHRMFLWIGKPHQTPG